MKKEFVPYEESLALKELRFDEPCFGFFYDEEFALNIKGDTLDIVSKKFNSCFTKESKHFQKLMVSAPTFSQAFRWFREKYKLHYSIDYECSQHDHKWGYNWSIYNYNLVIKTDDEYITSHPDAPSGEWVYDSYEEAELACLRKLIEIVKK